MKLKLLLYYCCFDMSRFLVQRYLFDFVHQLSSKVTTSLSLSELSSATKFFKISLASRQTFQLLVLCNCLHVDNHMMFFKL